MARKHPTAFELLKKLNKDQISRICRVVYRAFRRREKLFSEKFRDLIERLCKGLENVFRKGLFGKSSAIADKKLMVKLICQINIHHRKMNFVDRVAPEAFKQWI